MIIDSHAHVFDIYTSYGGRGESWAVGGGLVEFATGETMRILPEDLKNDNFTAETLLAMMDGAGVNKALLLQAGLYGFHNRYVHECSAKYPDRFTASYTLDPYASAAMDILAHIRSLGGRILKFELSTGAGLTGVHPYFLVGGREMDAICGFMDQPDDVIVLDVGLPGMVSYQIEGLSRLTKRYPTLKFVVCHLLAPDGSDPVGWERDIAKLIADNVWFDVTAIPWNIPEPHPFPTSANLVARAKELVGPEHLIWGSDIPLLLTRMTYEENLGYLVSSGKFSAREIDLLLRENAQTVYGI